MKDTIRYSESFKQKVVNEISKGKFISCGEASQAYGISGSCTVRAWVKKYGRTDLLPKVIKVETENDIDEISNRTHFLIVLLVGLFFAAALISGVLGASITRSISEPILSVSKLADELVHGNFKKKRLPVQSKSELGTLSHSFNELLDRLQKEKPDLID